jgi:hypothetical protein
LQGANPVRRSCNVPSVSRKPRPIQLVAVK